MPGVGKSHLAAALGLALIEHGYRVLFIRVDYRPLRAALAAGDCQSAVRTVGDHLPRSGHDGGAVDRLVHRATIFDINGEWRTRYVTEVNSDGAEQRGTTAALSGAPATPAIRCNTTGRKTAGRGCNAGRMRCAPWDEYQDWLDNLRESLQDSAVAAKLEAGDLDLTELESVELPLGYGRD